MNFILRRSTCSTAIDVGTVLSRVKYHGYISYNVLFDEFHIVELTFPGLHRYVLLVYKQKGEITETEWDNKNRASWSVANFAKKHDLGDPVAGNFFQVRPPYFYSLLIRLIPFSGEKSHPVIDGIFVTYSIWLFAKRILL